MSHFAPVLKVLQDFEYDIPKGIVFSQLLVCVDESWLLALEDKGITKNDDLKTALRLIDLEAAERHPLYTHQMELLDTKWMGSLLDLARSLNTRTMIAEWTTWNRDPAIFHFFLHITRDEEGKKVAHKILQDNPQGDYGKLIEELNRLEAAPWRHRDKTLHGKAVKGTFSATCKKPGQKTENCWGLCAFCSKFGYQQDRRPGESS